MPASVLSYLPEHAAFFVKVATETRPGPASDSASASGGAGEGESPVRPWRHAARVVGSGLLGFGTGTLAGYGAGMLADRLSGGVAPRSVALAAPVVGAAMGLAYNVYKQKELEELARAFESYKNQSRGRLGRQSLQG